MSDPQTLIDRLAAEVANEKRARQRGAAKAIAEYKIAIKETLAKLKTLGYDPLECLEVVE